MGKPFENLQFDPSFVRDLPGDPETENRRRQVLGACYSRVQPTPVAAPRLLAWSREMAETLGLAEVMDDPATAEILAGNALAAGMDPFAACYGGHQFGNWAGQLGDGRAISLGELVNDAGRFELQLKGAGPTPYSRGADGRAVVRSSVREFLCSEAMHHLGVPTTRALSLVTTGDGVTRDMFYDGRPEVEPGAVVCRVSPSFLRFGSWEIHSANREDETLRRLTAYAIRTHFPELWKPEAGADVETCVAWLAEICRRTAVMIAHWQRVGFVHGVMNTDNMSILGLTLDYGPYGWLDVYDPHWTPNTTDAQGRRYRFAAQPQIAHWNLVRFAEALFPLVGEAEPLEAALQEYVVAFQEASREMTAQKLGWDELRDDDGELFEDLEQLLTAAETDMTIFYRRLADVPVGAEASDEDLVAPVLDAYYASEGPSDGVRSALVDWLRRWGKRAMADDAERRQVMHRANPKYVLRNYLAQLAIDRAEEGDGQKVDELLEVMRRPYDEQPEHEEYAVKRPEWARNRPGCSMLSCSS